MIKLPNCFTNVEWEYEGDGLRTFRGWGGKMVTIAEPRLTTLTLKGSFTVEHRDGCLMFKGEQGTGTSYLLSCTEDEMIMVQNLLLTIRE